MADLLNKTAETPVATEEQEKEKTKKEKKAKEPKKQYLESNSMNFFERYEVIVEGKKNDVDISAYKTPILIVAVLLLVILVFAQGMNIFTKVQIKSLNKYINDSTNVSSYNEAVTVKEKIDGATVQKGNLETLISAIASYPNVNRAFFETINATATANNVSTINYGYASATGFLSISCTASSPQDITNFLRAMNNTKLFVNVDYNGFTGGTEGGYAFNIICYCAATK